MVLLIRPGGRRRARWGAVLGAFLLLVAATVAPAPAQTSPVELTVDPLFPPSITVGQTGQAQLQIRSVGTNGSMPVELTGITLNPACGSLSLACDVPDPGTIAISPTATGSAGACAGRAFTVTGPDPEGRYVFVPSSPVVLEPPGQPGNTCLLTFSFTVLKMPAFDVLPASAGSQTAHVATVTGSGRMGLDLTGQAVGRGLQTSTVLRAQPSISTRASGPVAAGGSVSDTATLSSPVATTGTVTFAAFGPDNATCSGAPAFTSTNPLTGRFAASNTFPVSTAGRYRFVATYNGDVDNAPVAGACTDPNEYVDVGGDVPDGTYHALPPARLLDTRIGAGGVAGPVGPASAIDVKVTDQGGIPASGVGAVVLNVTVTQPTAAGFLTLYPSGSAPPLASNLNFVPGQDVPNLVVVKVGADGRVGIYNSAGTSHVIFDVAGWFSDNDAGTVGRYRPLVPARIADSRNGTGAAVRLGPNASMELQVAGAGGVPATGADAAVLNVVATQTTAPGFVSVHPTGSPRPGVSNLNFEPGDTVANRAIVKLGTGGKVTIYNLAGGTDIVVDVGGWFTDASAPPAPGTFVAVQPARVLDTRDGTGGVVGTRPAGTAVEVQIAGRGGVPATGVSAVVLNVTATQPAAAGFLTLFPSGNVLPLASDLNVEAGETRPNLAVVAVGAGGKVTLYVAMQSHVVLDVEGWFLG